MRKFLFIFVFLFLLLFDISSDSFSLSTNINNVYPRKDFGFSMFPTGTSFGYSDRFKLFPCFEKAYFRIKISFSFDDVWYGSYSWDSGVPNWSLKPYEQNAEQGFNNFGVSTFRPASSIDLLIQQEFGINPFSGFSPLVSVSLGFNTRYALFLDSLSYSIDENEKSEFVDSLGNLRDPFNNSSIPAFPWLQGNRKLWNNFLYLTTNLSFDKYVGLKAFEGISADMSFEYGPWWLGNNVTPKGVTSDYYRISASVTENLPLYVKKQANGWNWFNIVLGHSNSFSYTGGRVVPEHKIPGDRLRASLSDSLWLTFTGPQFIASDCYAYIQISLDNTLYFGHIVNEREQKTTAIELYSSLSSTFHLRLFGFIHFQYDLGYKMVRGIKAENPGWWQSAELGFYVSL